MRDESVNLEYQGPDWIGPESCEEDFQIAECALKQDSQSCRQTDQVIGTITSAGRQ